MLVDGAAVPEHWILDSVQRIEQCGDRVTITAGGTRAANVGVPIEVKRWLACDDLMWQYPGFTCRLTRID